MSYLNKIVAADTSALQQISNGEQMKTVALIKDPVTLALFGACKLICTNS